MKGRAAWLAVFLCATAVSCSKSPVAPSAPTLNLAGNWTGTWTFVSAGATVVDGVTMTVTTASDNTFGSWSASSGAGGTVSFTTGATFTGTASISQTLISGPNCSAATTITGTAATSSLQFTLGSLTSNGLCQWAAGHSFAFAR